MVVAGRAQVSFSPSWVHNGTMKISKRTPKVDQKEVDAFEELFAKEYLKDFNACASLRRCGKSYKNNAIERSVASKLLAKPHVQDFIQKEFAERTAKVEVSVEDVLRNLKLMAESDILDAYNRDGSIKDVHKMPDGVRKMISSIETEHPISRPGVKVVKIKFWPKDKGIELLGKYLAMFVERQRVEDPQGNPLPAVQVHIHRAAPAAPVREGAAP